MTRILLADDSPHAQRMGEQILSEEGFEVVTVSDGDSALLRLEDVDPDLVLAGVTMAHRSGYEICQYVKLSPRHKHVRVVLAAGVKDHLDEAEARRAQADGVVQKPFQASVLLGAGEAAGGDGRERARIFPGAAAGAAVGSGKRPASKAPVVALIDPERVRAAVTVALDASLSGMIDEITEKVHDRAQHSLKSMPDNSFDVVSKIELPEVSNAIQQALKEIQQRYDLKDSNSSIELNEKDHKIVLASQDEYKLKAVIEVLEGKLVKRKVPLKGLTYGTIIPAAGSSVKQEITLQQGIPIEKAREIVRKIKDSKLKVQAAIQGDLVRVSGRDRDTLQSVDQAAA